MANLNVRISNKFDTYENWMNSKLVLNAGEIAIAKIETSNGTGLTPPAIGVKVGDGSKTFAELGWIQATAGDVSAWAKAANKPTYDAEEIVGLEAYISGQIQDTNTTYKFEVNGSKLEIFSKEKTDLAFGTSPLATFDLTAAFGGKVDKVVGTAGNIMNFGADGAIVDSGVKISDYYTKTEADAKFALDSELTTLESTVSGISTRLGTAEDDIDALQNAITALEGTTHFIGVKEELPTTAKAGDVCIVGNKEYIYDTTKKWIELGDTSAEVERISALEGVVGDAKSGLVADVAAHTSAIATLEGKVTDIEKDLGDIAEGAVAAHIADTDMHIQAGERAKWNQAATDATAAKTAIGDANSGLTKKVADAEANITAIDGRVGTLETDNTANKGAISGLESKVTALEGKVDVAKVSTAIATAKSEAISAAASDAATKANAAKEAAIADAADKYEEKGVAADLVDALANGAVKTNTQAIAAHETTLTTLSNKVDVDKVSTAIATAKGEAIDAAKSDATQKAGAAESAAKAYTDGEISKTNARVKTLEDANVADKAQINQNKADIATNATAISKNTNRLAGIAEDSTVVAYVSGAISTATANMETTSGAQQKASAAETAAKTYADGKFEEKGVAEAKVKALADGQVAQNKTDIATNAQAISNVKATADTAVQDVKLGGTSKKTGTTVNITQADIVALLNSADLVINCGDSGVANN